MDTVRATADSDSVQAVLAGGPADIPEALRFQMVRANDKKIKVEHYGGYEHFERNSEHDRQDPSRPLIFQWTMRTEIAE